MRILILGGDGMLGHQLWLHFRDRYETYVTLRRDFDAYTRFGLFDRARTFAGVDARNFDAVQQVFAEVRPTVVLNAIGIVKQRPTARDSIISLEINALLPHRLAVLCKAVGARLIHPSTDCVFSGNKGGYVESDKADAEDLYGLTKYLGEVSDPHCLTLRTSIIGLELERRSSLVEWFLHSGPVIRGYRKAIFSGLTTMELSRVVEKVIVSHPSLSGVYHVSTEPISKFDLLSKLNDILGLRKHIIPDDSVICDRSLNSDRFRHEVGYQPPAWDDLLEELASHILERSGEAHAEN